MSSATVEGREMTELLGSQGSEERVTGLSKRTRHEADGIDQVWKLRWELNGCQT